MYIDIEYILRLNPFRKYSKNVQKVIVTKFQNEKCNCEHYGLSVIFNIFFKSKTEK